MTTLLPTLVSNPFRFTLDHKHHTFWSPFSNHVQSPAGPGGSLTDIPLRQELSPISTKSAIFVPYLRNNENKSPLSIINVRPSKLSANPASVVASHQDECADLHQSTPRCQQVCLEIPVLPIAGGIKALPSPKQQAHLEVPKSQKYHFQNDTPTKAKQSGNVQHSGLPQLGHKSSSTADSNDSDSLEPFPILRNNESLTAEVENEFDSSQQEEIIKISTSPNVATTTRFRFKHQQRPSNASSRFVHTIKTASMSNASLSIVPRSLRIGRSSESHGLISATTRHSLDSDRPGVESSLDEGAIRRGLKRKQVLNELIMTEESYVADIKALVYLYSTLLISATTVPSHLRQAIQSNITELLHIHEDLLERLHQATFKAAARKWADTEAPTRLPLTHRIRWRQAGLCSADLAESKHSRVRSSIDSSEMSKVSMIVGVAEPAEVLDIAEIFNFIMPKLYAYEEYCANHEVIAQELQRHLPGLWATYESGMESLNTSLIALNRRKHYDRKCLTVGDLLIKPVQRICKYPLLLNDLIKYTPVVDGPGAHQLLDNVLSQLRNIVQTVNSATDNHLTRTQIQRKWLVRDRLLLSDAFLSWDQYRALGNVQLCGVLYLTLQNDVSEIEGSYAMCVLFDNHFLVTKPVVDSKFEPIVLISLADLQIESAMSGKGLRSVSALHTWKVTFTSDNNLHEILLSACSRTEEDRWVQGLQGRFRPAQFLQLTTMFDQSTTFKSLKCLGTTFRPFTPISKQSSRDQSSTLQCRTDRNKVIVRNTHNPSDWQELRNITPAAAQGSLPHTGSSRVVILSPKRAERTRLETSLSDVYTKDRLPFPGMIGSKGSQIIRASAGSLARKLSFASMQATFSKRSASLSSRKSYHTIQTVPKDPSTFSVRKQNVKDLTPSRKGKPRELPELDTMDSVIGRMIGSGPGRKRLSFSSGEKLIRKNTKNSRSQRVSTCQVGPEDPAAVFYKDDSQFHTIEKETNVSREKGKEKARAVEAGLSGSRKKRWSNPISKLKGLGSDGIRNMLYSSA